MTLRMTRLIRHCRLLAAAMMLGSLTAPLRAQDDVADVPSRKIAIGGDESKSYFLIGARETVKAPDKGFGLIVIMPAGDGSAEFHPFVKRIFKNALPEGYLAAQPVAVKWTEGQQIVWPTEVSKVEGQKFSTEKFVQDVISDVRSAQNQKLDPARIFTLTWSSSGPAAYAISLTEGAGVTGSFVAMSVFKPNQLPPLTAAKGHAYFIYHSPDDKVCPMRMAEQARDDLKNNDAKVEFKTYPGGHGWRGPLYVDIRAGIEWLEQNAVKPAAKNEKKAGDKK
jgi:predicted esterase